MKVDGHQRDADQAHVNPPLSHLELSGGGVSFLPLGGGVTGNHERQSNRRVSGGVIARDAASKPASFQVSSFYSFERDNVH